MVSETVLVAECEVGGEVEETKQTVEFYEVCYGIRNCPTIGVRLVRQNVQNDPTGRIEAYPS